MKGTTGTTIGQVEPAGQEIQRIKAAGMVGKPQAGQKIKHSRQTEAGQVRQAGKVGQARLAGLAGKPVQTGQA
jgi:hypothetical protein